MIDATPAFEDEKIDVANNMVSHGGSFVKALGEALFKADIINANKIKAAFPEYWERYKNFNKSK